MKKGNITQIICSLLILLFGYAALSKLVDHETFQAQLLQFPWLSGFTGFVSWLIPITELFTVLLLFLPGYTLYGLYAACISLLFFTIFLILMISFDKDLPCSCGGVIAKLSWQQHVFFNLFFLFLSIIGMVVKKHSMNFTPGKTEARFSA